MAKVDHIVTAACCVEDALFEMEALIKSYGDLVHYGSDHGGDFVEEPAWLTVVSRQFWKLRDLSRTYLDVVHRDAMPVVRDMESVSKSRP